MNVAKFLQVSGFMLGFEAPTRPYFWAPALSPFSFVIAREGESEALEVFAFNDGGRAPSFAPHTTSFHLSLPL